ncbi:hypothetical protein L2E82_25470 [Cichorium intybus]|uniref:Uncharacterized protein n=1 Tax=Cichorium intybus TaxID=13427 RepID=A0ACB9E455_CICIN|nr:hypothetical protein L2E82_25470 [Cichorium intybus]
MKKFIQLVYLVDCETNNGILFTRNQLSLYHLQTPQAPIVCIATYEKYRIHDSPLGTNAIVVLLAYSRVILFGYAPSSNQKFDHDSNGTVDLEEFKAETKRMMLDMANDIGFLSVQMILDEDSFLKKAIERELTKLQSDTSA